MAGLKKGQCNNPNGRKKGVPNKITQDLRERITAFLDDNWTSIEKDFKAIPPRERLMFYEKLMSYAVPKLQTVVMDTKIDATIQMPTLNFIPTTNLPFDFFDTSIGID